MSTLARTAAIDWAKRIAADPRALFLDTETLGKPNDSEICDIGIVGIDGRIWFDELIRPSIPIPAEASAIHGITNAMVADAPSWSDIVGDVAEALTAKTIVIYNAGYDVPIINNANQRIGDVFVIAGECAMLEFARFMGVPGFKGQWKWHRLDIAAAHFGIPPGGHRALADAETARKVVLAMAASGESVEGVAWLSAANQQIDRVVDLMTDEQVSEIFDKAARASPNDPTQPQRTLFDLPDPTRYTR